MEHDWKTVHREQTQWTDDISIWQECTRCHAVRCLKDKVEYRRCPTCSHETVVPQSTGIIGAHHWASRMNERGPEFQCVSAVAPIASSGSSDSSVT
jgi:hypothetical protein